MTAIWSEGTEGWELLAPTGFPDERTLQEIVATAPDLLPLSGTPRVIVLGREVLHGVPVRTALATLWCWTDGSPVVSLWRSVLARAPGSIANVEAAPGGAKIGQGTSAPAISKQLLDALFDAYVEAASTNLSDLLGEQVDVATLDLLRPEVAETAAAEAAPL